MNFFENFEPSILAKVADSAGFEPMPMMSNQIKSFDKNPKLYKTRHGIENKSEDVKLQKQITELSKKDNILEDKFEDRNDGIISEEFQMTSTVPFTNQNIGIVSEENNTHETKDAPTEKMEELEMPPIPLLENLEECKDEISDEHMQHFYGMTWSTNVEEAIEPMHRYELRLRNVVQYLETFYPTDSSDHFVILKRLFHLQNEYAKCFDWIDILFKIKVICTKIDFTFSRWEVLFKVTKARSIKTRKEIEEVTQIAMNNWPLEEGLNYEFPNFPPLHWRMKLSDEEKELEKILQGDLKTLENLLPEDNQPKEIAAIW